jgi:hypothetical protein
MLTALIVVVYHPAKSGNALGRPSRDADDAPGRGHAVMFTGQFMVRMATCRQNASHPIQHPAHRALHVWV